MLSMVNRITKQDRIFIASCFIWGMLAHGIILFHKLCFHDDQVALFWHHIYVCSHNLLCAR